MLHSIGIDHLNLTVNNLEESVDFYKNVFDLEEKERGKSISGTDFAIVGKKNSLYLCLYDSEGSGVDYGKSFGHLGINVENFDEVEKKLEELNVPIELKYSYQKSKSIYINDPNGIEIEISSKFGGGLE